MAQPMTPERYERVHADVVDPAQRIIDSHRHLWPVGGRLPYGLNEFKADVASGHRVEHSEYDEASVVTLWTEAGLVRPWNEAGADFHRAVDGALSAVLGMKDGDALLGTVMVGYDGHRGWIYYLAVSPTRRREGLGRLLMDAAERWFGAVGAIKAQRMVRGGNEEALGFYESLGYEHSDVRVLARWLAE